MTLKYGTPEASGYVKIGDHWFKTGFKIGDNVERVTRASSYTSDIQKGRNTVVTAVTMGSSTSDYFQDYGPNGTMTYTYVYEQAVTVQGSTRKYNGSNFKLIKGVTPVLQIEVDRPTFVREFTEVLKEGESKPTREYVGDWVEFKTQYLAQIWTSNQISESIRKENTYRKFSILVEKSVARAKNPEIEFA